MRGNIIGPSKWLIPSLFFSDKMCQFVGTEGREEAAAVFILNGCLKCNAAGWRQDGTLTASWRDGRMVVQIE